MEIQVWLSVLIPKVEVFRGITLIPEDPCEPSTFLPMLKHELVRDRGFDSNKRRLAELWILRGDWTFKKRYFLELSDFYPSEQQIKSLVNDTMVLLSRNELALKVRKAKEEGKREAESQIPPPSPPDEREKQLYGIIDKLLLEKKDIQNQESERNSELVALRLEVERQKKLIENMKDARLRKEREVMEEIKNHNTNRNRGAQRLGNLLNEFKEKINE